MKDILLSTEILSNEKELIEQAINKLLQMDQYLLEINANERTISHRLGIYLQELFPDWHVDCEYNRYLDEIKRIDKYEELIGKEANRGIAETDTITVFPDIIIHRRGTHENLVVIEIKKTSSNKSRKMDYYKLNEFVNSFNYKYAIFLELITDAKPVGISKIEYICKNIEQDKY